jgi:hypothetical protein
MREWSKELRLMRALAKEEPTPGNLVSLALLHERHQRFRAAERWYAAALAISEPRTRHYTFAEEGLRRVREHFKRKRGLKNT